MRYSSIIVCFIAASAAILKADTIILKTGKQFTGRVISEDTQSYLFEVNVTSTIKEEKRILKDHVREIIEESADAKEFKKIDKLIPTPDLLPAPVYNNKINTVKKFISQFPKSPHIKQAKKILASLEKEHAVISSGGIKQDGQLISRSDMEANAYDIHARMIVRDMQKLSSNQQYREALRKWSILSEDYRNSSSFKQGIPIARRSTLIYQRQLQNLLKTLEARTSKRKSALDSLNANDRARTEVALADAQKKYQALLEKETSTLKLKWLTVDPYDKSSISSSYRLTISELNSIEKIDTSKIQPAGSSYRDAWTALAEGDIENATKHINTLQSLRLPARYLDPLKNKLKGKKEAEKAAKEKAKIQAAEEKARQKQLAKEAAEKAEAEKNKKPQRKKK